MSDSVKLLLINREPRRIVDDDTTLPDVIEYYSDQMGERRARQQNYSLREIPSHTEL